MTRKEKRLYALEKKATKLAKKLKKVMEILSEGDDNFAWLVYDEISGILEA